LHAPPEAARAPSAVRPAADGPSGPIAVTCDR